MQTSLDKIKQEMTNKVVNELENIRYMTPKEKELYKATLLAKLQEKMLCTSLRLQHGLTNADD